MNGVVTNDSLLIKKKIDKSKCSIIACVYSVKSNTLLQTFEKNIALYFARFFLKQIYVTLSRLSFNRAFLTADINDHTIPYS